MDPQGEPERPAGRPGRRGERFLREGVRDRQVSESVLGETWADVQGEEGIASKKTLTTRCRSVQETVTVVHGYGRKCARGRVGARTSKEQHGPSGIGVGTDQRPSGAVACYQAERRDQRCG